MEVWARFIVSNYLCHENWQRKVRVFGYDYIVLGGKPFKSIKLCFALLKPRKFFPGTF